MNLNNLALNSFLNNQHPETVWLYMVIKIAKRIIISWKTTNGNGHQTFIYKAFHLFYCQNNRTIAIWMSMNFLLSKHLQVTFILLNPWYYFKNLLHIIMFVLNLCTTSQLFLMQKVWSKVSLYKKKWKWKCWNSEKR